MIQLQQYQQKFKVATDKLDEPTNTTERIIGKVEQIREILPLKSVHKSQHQK